AKIAVNEFALRTSSNIKPPCFFYLEVVKRSCIPTQEYYAHSVEGKPTSEWQGLEEHLTPPQSSPCQGEVGGVAARKFADEFGSGDWAYLAGLRHDVGKCLFVCIS
ncbi:MAG: hypothetical protein COZ31_04500, partial [Nitrospirae bacterium CG_4_10_14_3_um_filter_44_29]